MKKCQLCGKRATMFLTQIINGQVTELALCEACAKAKGLFDPQSLTFAEKFFPDELKHHMERILKELHPDKEELRAMLPHATPPDMLTQCPACKFTLADLRRSGRVGCPDCYSVFASEFDASGSGADAEQGGGDAADDEPSPALKRSKLERKLRDAVEREDYEEAARLRDELGTLDDR